MKKTDFPSVITLMLIGVYLTLFLGFANASVPKWFPDCGSVTGIIFYHSLILLAIGIWHILIGYENWREK